MISGPRDHGEGSGRLAEVLETLRELRGDLKELRRDLDDLDERFGTFKGRVDKRRGVAKAAEQEDPPASGPESSRHPDVVAILRRRGEG